MNDILTTTEVARILRVDLSTVRRWVRDGTLQAITLPNKGGKKIRYRFYRSVIEKILEEKPITPEKEPSDEPNRLPG